MGFWEKVFFTFIITFFGGMAYGIIKDTFGEGHYVFRVAEILLLIYIWTRPGRQPDPDRKRGL